MDLVMLPLPTSTEEEVRQEDADVGTRDRP